MRATSLFVLVILGSIASVAPTAALGRRAEPQALRTFLVRGAIASGKNTQYFGSFEIAAEPPNRFVQTETRAYFDADGTQDRHTTAMGFDGARTIYQPDVPNYPTVPILVRATKQQEQQIRAAAEAALQLVETPIMNGARAPFTMTKNGETWTVRDLKINVDLPNKLFRPR